MLPGFLPVLMACVAGHAASATKDALNLTSARATPASDSASMANPVNRPTRMRIPPQASLRQTEAVSVSELRLLQQFQPRNTAAEKIRRIDAPPGCGAHRLGAIAASVWR